MNFLALMTGLYTYDKLSGSSSFKRAGLAALAGVAVEVVTNFAAAAILVSLGYATKNTAVSGLPDAWGLDMLPPSGGIPVNIYDRMPDAINVGDSFGNV